MRINCSLAASRRRQFVRYVVDDPYAIGHRSVSNRGNCNSLWGATVGRGHMNCGVIAPGNHLFRIRCAEHHPADHGSIMYTNVPALDAICVIFRPPNMQRGRRGHDRALHCVSKISTLNYNLNISATSQKIFDYFP